MKSSATRSSVAGFTLLEVLISLVIVALGLLGLAGLQIRMQQAELESYQRSQAVIFLHDMVERIRTNKATAPCFAFTTNLSTGAPYVGGTATTPSGCAASNSANNTMADASLAAWVDLLKGAAETSGTDSVGSIIGALGCVSYGGAATEVIGPTGARLGGTGVYTVSVSWQGVADTVTPSVNCGNGQYGSETKRRTISTTFQIARLN